MYRARPTMQVLKVVGPTGLKKGTASHAIAATQNVKPGGGDGFERATLPFMEEVQAEPGNLLCSKKSDN